MGNHEHDPKMLTKSTLYDGVNMPSNREKGYISDFYKNNINMKPPKYMFKKKFESSSRREHSYVYLLKPSKYGRIPFNSFKSGALSWMSEADVREKLAEFKVPMDQMNIFVGL